MILSAIECDASSSLGVGLAIGMVADAGVSEEMVDSGIDDRDDVFETSSLRTYTR